MGKSFELSICAASYSTKERHHMPRAVLCCVVLCYVTCFNTEHYLQGTLSIRLDSLPLLLFSCSHLLLCCRSLIRSRTDFQPSQVGTIKVFNPRSIGTQIRISKISHACSYPLWPIIQTSTRHYIGKYVLDIKDREVRKHFFLSSFYLPPITPPVVLTTDILRLEINLLSRSRFRRSRSRSTGQGLLRRCGCTSTLC